MGVVLRVLCFDTSYVFWDESIYLMGGEVLAGHPAGYNELDFRPPLLTVMITPFAFSSYYLYLSKVFMILVNTFFVFLVYVFAKQFNKQIGLLSAFLVSIWPYHLMSSGWVMTDGLAAVTLLLTILFYFKGFKQKQDELVYWGGFFLGLAILAKFTNILLFILLLPLFISNLKRIKTILKSFLIAFLTISPYLIISYLRFGNPLHGILKAFTVGNAVISSIGLQPISMIIKVFYDFFGIVLSVFLFAGFLLFIKKEIFLQKDKTTRKNNFFWAYCFVIFLLYYFYTVHEGATPIWWDSQRFLLSFLPFGLMFSTYFIVESVKRFSKKTKLITLTLLVILVLLSWTQQYSRFAQPAISHENGLRYVTKDLGLYLKEKDINNLLCLGNCPPIAYYSDKKLTIVYNIKDFKLKQDQYGVIFSDKVLELEDPYEQVKKICNDRWCAYILKNMGLEEKIGQMIITTRPKSEQELEKLLNDYHVGGFVYMGWPNDIQNMGAEQINSLTTELQKKSKISLFIMADIEGGEVNRISNFFDIKSNQKYGQEYEKAADKKEFIKNYTQDIEEVAKVLKEIGINVNLAPVLDVEQTLKNGVLSKYERAYSTNPDVVSELGPVYIEQMQKNGVQTTAKHFPGHGHTDCDTYLEKCRINISKEYLEQNDLQPFKLAIKKDVSFIMIGLFETPYDQKIAALSKNVITDLLRERLEYKNIVITDDITMGAMKELEKEKIAIETIAAGSDIILTTNPNDVQIIHNSILQAIKEGKISEERIDNSVGRILQMKSKL